MDLTQPNPTTNSGLSASNTAVFGDNVNDWLNTGVLNCKPTAMITVNSIADVVDNNDGVTTLREAIAQANADSGKDSIVFDQERGVGCGVWGCRFDKTTTPQTGTSPYIYV